MCENTCEDLAALCEHEYMTSLDVFGYLSADAATDVWRVGSDCVTDERHGAV